MNQVNFETLMRAVVESLSEPRFGCYEVSTNEVARMAVKELAKKGVKAHVTSRGHNLPRTLIVKD